MKTIFKYELHDAFKITPFKEISMPKDAQILKIDAVRNTGVIYAVIDTDIQENEKRKFCLFPTGGNIDALPDENIYLDTIQLNNGTLILHIFEIIKPKEDETGNNSIEGTEDITESSDE